MEIKEGQYFPTPKGLKWTYGQLLDRYLEYAKVTKKPSTYETDTYWAKHLRAAFGSMRLKEVSADKVTTYTGPWVFPNPKTDKPYRKDANTAWYTALKKADLQGVHFHDLRHTTGSHLRMQGADLFTIKEILGHKDLRMTARYAHVGQQHRLAAVAALERAYQLPVPKGPLLKKSHT